PIHSSRGCRSIRVLRDREVFRGRMAADVDAGGGHRDGVGAVVLCSAEEGGGEQFGSVVAESRYEDVVVSVGLVVVGAGGGGKTGRGGPAADIGRAVAADRQPEALILSSASQ